MSHYVIMVVGNDPDTLLAPYDEEDCRVVDVSDRLQGFVDESERSGESLRDILEKDDYNCVSEEEHCKGYSGKFGWRWYTEDGVQVTGLYHYTNPNAKWDWYEIGGRWRDSFQFKDGISRKPSVAKSLYDFDAMKEKLTKEAGENWDRIRTVLFMSPLVSWEEAKTRYPESEGAARQFYNNQPVIKELSRIGVWLDDSIKHIVNDSREDYCKYTSARYFPCYAILDEDGWHAQGEMGWWGMSADDYTEEEWQGIVEDYLKVIPDDTKLTFVDCHI